MTTIRGFIPLILWGGIFWPPLAVAVMVGATILALYFVPPLYVLFQRKQGHTPAAQVPREAVRPALPELETT